MRASLFVLAILSLAGCTRSAEPSSPTAPLPSGAKADGVVAPVCSEVGTDDEGWYDGETGALLCHKSCADAEPARCDAIGSRSEGWYTGDDQGCHAGGLIGWAACATPPPPPEPVPPVCSRIGTRSEGWYDAETDRLICFSGCSTARAAECGAIGSRSEGWYTDEGLGCNGRALIRWDSCAPPEPPPPPTPARPECRNRGTRSEGWWDPTTNTRICFAGCSDAEAPRCDAIGTRGEGWYTSEGMGCGGSDLIQWAMCSE